MYETVDKYIYKIGENNYRIKIKKKDSETGLELNISKNYNATLEEIKKIRDNFINDFDEKIILALKEKRANTPIVKEKFKIELVDKYIYLVDRGKYRIRIKKGSRGEIGYYTFTETIEGSLSDARKIRDRKLAELKLYTKPPSDRGNITLEDFVKVFFENYTSGYSPTTLFNMKNKIKYYILPSLGKYKLNKINVLLLQNFVSGLLKQKKKNSNELISKTTANTIYRTLRNLLNRAVDWEYIEKNPLLKVRPPSVSKREKNTLNLEELSEVIKYLKKEHIELQCLAIIVITTGIRRGELLGIHLEDIDLDENVFYIRHNIVRDGNNHKVIEISPKTKESIREVPFPNLCKDILIEYLKYREEKMKLVNLVNPKSKDIKNIFTNDYGNYMNPDYPSKKWKEFLKKNGLKVITMHEIRHSYCSLQVNDNKELGIKDVAVLLGHSQLSTTFHYSHSNRDKKEKVLSIFEKLEDGKNFDISVILSICKNKLYCSSSKIQELVEYIVNDKKLSYLEKYQICRMKLIEQYSEINLINDNMVDINNVFDWLEEIGVKYGKEIYIKKEDVVEDIEKDKIKSISI